MDYKLIIKKYKQVGDMAWEYNPLRNFKLKDGSISDFRIKNSDSGLNINLENPIDIECQPSYDGTVNLYLNDGANPPRLVNTRWTRTENNTFKIINREQINQSNIYREDYVDRETRLFRNVDGVTKIDLNSVNYSGKLKAGNYIVYMKYMDDDYNETDIVAQSGVISIFNGTISSPMTISGGMMDEETDKSICLEFRNLDTSFSYFKLYIYRTTCDSNGIKLDYAYKIDYDYEITNTSRLVYINGFEDVVDISVEELNIQYNTVDSVESQAQVQNMLFFANTTKSKDYDPEIQNISLYIKAEEVVDNESIGFINPDTYSPQDFDDVYKTEYYSPLNIYYKLGYWPDEWYRFGIVYIYNDDHLSPVYNLRGCEFQSKTYDDGVHYYNYDSDSEYNSLDLNDNKIPISSWIEGGKKYQNTKGVFRFSKRFKDMFKAKDREIHPIGIKFSLENKIVLSLRNKKIKGFFLVRQPRIPTILCQGYSIGVDNGCYIPMLKYEDKYIAESFINSSKTLSKSNDDRILSTKNKQSSGLLCVDAYLNKQLQSMFDTSEFKLEKVCRFEAQKDGTLDTSIKNGSMPGSGTKRSSNYRHYWANIDNYNPTQFESSNTNLIYIDPEIPQKIFNDYGFSTKAGMQEDLKYSGFFEKENKESKDPKLIRGIFTSYIGTTTNLEDNCLYNIRVKNYNNSFSKEYFEIRMNDNRPYYAISQRYNLLPKDGDVDKACFDDNNNMYLPITFGGDCFTNTVTTRMHRNFTSSSVPINDTIIDEQTWKENFVGVRYTTDWDKINKADVDAVPIGSWMTYKCMSNYNLGLRCIDPFQIEEQSLMGNPRSFYPIQDISVKSSNKINESNLMNDGYNSLLGVKRNFTFDLVPYVKDIFDTRIMFSNIQVDGAFKNSYKIFQGLSYEDIDRQYGSITKILPWGVNLFCVFEHGLAIIPVNEKALLQTTEGSNIHMYGTGVLQKQVVLISDKVGSRWKDSIVRTPLGVYGVDADTHKIWRYTDEKKLEIISDFKIQRYLHDNIDIKESDKYIILGSRNIKAHYNAFKGDVMFTYYNGDKVWNICYNENLSKWITRYSWTPYMSENIDHSMFSFDLLRTRSYGLLNTNLNRANKDNDCYVTYKRIGEYKYHVPDFVPGKISFKQESISLDVNINNPYTYYNIDSIVLKAFYWDGNRIKYDIINDGLDYSFVNVKDEGEGSSVEERMYDYYNNNVKGNKHKIIFNSNNIDDKYLYFNIDLKYTPYTIAEIKNLYNDNIQVENETNVFIWGNEQKNYSIGLIRDINIYKESEYIDHYNNALINSIFVHGRSINADEINYFDKNEYNQCLPTKWYDTQHPFEFEVVVNEPKGLHKIFDNLIIISNNVEPESLEVEITGDVYGFNKEGIFKSDKVLHNIDIIPADKVKNNIDENGDIIDYRLVKQVNTRVHWDPIENSYSLAVHQDMINIKDYGRRLGNIYYNEDKWYITLKPIYFKERDSLKSAKIRDKYAKIRVKYSGDKLAIIVALQTMFTLSYV